LVNVEAFYYINYTLHSYLASKYNKVILYYLFHSFSTAFQAIFLARPKGHLMIIDRFDEKVERAKAIKKRGSFIFSLSLGDGCSDERGSGPRGEENF